MKRRCVALEALIDGSLGQIAPSVVASDNYMSSRKLRQEGSAAGQPAPDDDIEEHYLANSIDYNDLRDLSVVRLGVQPEHAV